MRRIRSPVNSLAFRLLASAAIWAALALVAGGYLLSNLFQNSVQRTFDRRLEADIDGLIGGLQHTPDLKIQGVRLPTDPRYGNVFSGWYWQIVPLKRNGTSLTPLEPEAAERENSDSPLRSESLFDFELGLPGPLAFDQDLRGGALGPQTGAPGERQRLRYVVRVRAFEAPRSGAPPGAAPIAQLPALSPVYAFMVAGLVDEVEADIANFNTTLIWSIAILATGLFIAVIVQVRLGLAPLASISQKLGLIREGKAESLEGEFPAEISPLVSELNALIAHNTEVVARARTHVGNLAHFLKTPLSVLSNEAVRLKGPLAEIVTRQTEIMRRQVDHYLARARAAGSARVVGSRTEIAPVIADLARALERIYAGRGIEIEQEIPAGLSFRGERQDFEEMAGNLIDNACKWAKAGVWVKAESGEGGQLILEVRDDGPGLSPEERSRVMQRGERLDESKPGSGLGLSIVREIAGLYGGAVELDAAPEGGVLARLKLPGVKT